MQRKTDQQPVIQSPQRQVKRFERRRRKPSPRLSPPYVCTVRCQLRITCFSTCSHLLWACFVVCFCSCCGQKCTSANGLRLQSQCRFLRVDSVCEFFTSVFFWFVVLFLSVCVSMCLCVCACLCVTQGQLVVPSLPFASAKEAGAYCTLSLRQVLPFPLRHVLFLSMYLVLWLSVSLCMCVAAPSTVSIVQSRRLACVRSIPAFL